MPAAFCSNPITYDFWRDNNLVHATCELTWDGVSTPTTGCDGVISRVRWVSTSQRPWYVHFPDSKKGPAVYQILPGTTGDVTDRPTLHFVGLDSRSDVVGAGGVDLNEIPPQPGERLLNP